MTVLGRAQVAVLPAADLDLAMLRWLMLADSTQANTRKDRT